MATPLPDHFDTVPFERLVADNAEQPHDKRVVPRCIALAKTPAPNPGLQRFLAEARANRPPVNRDATRHRILFALDATASREPTWDLAMNLHAELFEAAASENDPEGGTVAVQLVYYRGYNEFHASPWSVSPGDLLSHMTGVACRGGLTQIRRVLAHALAESKRNRIKAGVLVADACEEPYGALTAAAGQLALFNLPLFVFQEGNDPVAGRVFRDIARITGGAHAPFAPGSADQLHALFGAVARYAARGREGVREIEHQAVRGMLSQLAP